MTKPNRSRPEEAYLVKGIERLTTDWEVDYSNPNATYFTNRRYPRGQLSYQNIQEKSWMTQLNVMPTKPAHLRRGVSPIQKVVGLHYRQKGMFEFSFILFQFLFI